MSDLVIQDLNVDVMLVVELSMSFPDTPCSWELHIYSDHISVRLNPGASAVDMAACGCTYDPGIGEHNRVRVSSYKIYNIHFTLVSDSMPFIREFIICTGSPFYSQFMHLMAPCSDGEKICNIRYLLFL